jgi:DNA-binding transcriptional MocR family regulator
MRFFRAALERKVITVPGEFFDVNPGKRRKGHGSRFQSYVRFSFGPPASSVGTALGRLADMVREA